MLIGGLFLYKTYAFYEEEKEFNVLKGTIPEFGYDIKMLSVVIDDKKSNTIPERGMYKTNVHCTNGTFGEWDYNNWNLVLNNVSSESKCNIEFTSGLSESDYNKYIEAGKALHRNTYRGKDITSYLTDGSLYTRIENGSFEDIYVGDYIEANGYTWLIADIDNYLFIGGNSNSKGMTQHHATIIPSRILPGAPMNDTKTTEGGYANSKMATETLPSLVTNEGIIGKVFGDHILEYQNNLTDSVNIEKGVSTNFSAYTRKIDLMSEVNVLGTIVTSLSLYDVGNDYSQYAIFALKPELKNSDGKNRFSYWLKSVTGSSTYAYIKYNGFCDGYVATTNGGVRPRFLIG